MHQELSNDSDFFIQRVGQGIQLFNTRQINMSDNHQSLSEIYQLPLCIYFLDVNSRLQSLNESELNLLNIYSISDVIGLTAKYLTGATAESWIENDREVLDTRKMLVKEETFTQVDDSIISFLTFKFPWYNHDNDLLGVFGMSIVVDKGQEVSLA